MSRIYNIYCDESCHLERDGQKVMVLGALWCPKRSRARHIAERIRRIKTRHGLAPDFEIKWSKVSPAKAAFYLDLLDYFFKERNLHFRALIADKRVLRHAELGTDHDTWYYKMYFHLLKVLFSPRARYHVYLDLKDTRGAEKVRKLHTVLCNDAYDFDRAIIQRIQLVRSHEVEQIQLADLLIGIVGYANRGLTTSAAKVRLVARMRELSRYSLLKTTLLREDKVNLFHWSPKEGDQA